MKNKLILIHGRAQESFEEMKLKQDWIDSLNEGLAKSNLSLPSDVKIEFPYYGKLLDKIVNEKKSGNPTIYPSTRSGQVYREDAEILFMEEYLQEMAKGLANTPEEMAELKEATKRERGILNNERVQRLLSFIDRRQKMGEWVFKKATEDTYMYLKFTDIRKQIDDLVLNSFDDTPCVVVAHSMGSIIAYLLLKQNPTLKVKQFITVGSPLGLSSIQKLLGKPLVNPCPEGCTWHNAYDERDFVALHPLDDVFFKVNPSANIENRNNIDNQTDNRHKIVGYLNDMELSKRIYEALSL